MKFHHILLIAAGALLLMRPKQTPAAMSTVGTLHQTDLPIKTDEVPNTFTNGRPIPQPTIRFVQGYEAQGFMP